MRTRALAPRAVDPMGLRDANLRADSDFARDGTSRQVGSTARYSTDRVIVASLVWLACDDAGNTDMCVRACKTLHQR